ncbi:hypothetical protein BDZ89DRAFT_1006617 [Hymenopellis radicata]|nr:hypothetical protein BDZ89DRAFT_1006617 [Hymenopellis radicata]
MPSGASSKLRKSSHRSLSGSRQVIGSAHWLFKSTVTSKRSSYIGPDIRKRSFFGMGEIFGVLTNPAETVRSLTESKRLLDEARREISENRERAQIRTKHTFSRLPGFFPRKAEVKAIERALEGDPSFTILFGASSVGKTALLREVLSRESYHVLHFDLRIAGFADLSSLYMSLSQQMEQYFEAIAQTMEGYDQFEKEAWSFKHDRLNVERRIAETNESSTMRKIMTSDVARLMELFQSSLLRYWEFQPSQEELESASAKSKKRGSDVASEKTQIVDHPHKRKWSIRRLRPTKPNEDGASRSSTESEKKGIKAPPKRMPVIFFDEAHKLPALIQSTETMKCILDSMLVFTKQDRLCHVIHATSDPFYQTWLRQLNIMQHCKIITIGDCNRTETRRFYHEQMLPRVPEYLRHQLDFESLYEAFGGKFAHWHDYITDYVNSNGRIGIRQSSHFLQAHALLNLHIIHSSQSPSTGATSSDGGRKRRSTPTADSVHPGLGPAGFKIYSPITSCGRPPTADSTTAATYDVPEFTAMELLNVMSRITGPDVDYLPYFSLCRELGVRAVDGMVKGRVLDLRWTEPVTNENHVDGRMTRPTSTYHPAANSDVTAVNSPPAAVSEEGDMEAISEQEQEYYLNHHHEWEDDDLEVVGPKLVPTTPIMRFAMAEVVAEYEDAGTESEYASLTDVDEY